MIQGRRLLYREHKAIGIIRTASGLAFGLVPSHGSNNVESIPFNLLSAKLRSLASLQMELELATLDVTLCDRIKAAAAAAAATETLH